jgi:hypothetical protein
MESTGGGLIALELTRWYADDTQRTESPVCVLCSFVRLHGFCDRNDEIVWFLERNHSILILAE